MSPPHAAPPPVPDGPVPEPVPAPRSAYPGKAELVTAFDRFRAAAAKLARHPSTHARMAAALLVTDAVTVLSRLADDADQTRRNPTPNHDHDHES